MEPPVPESIVEQEYLRAEPLEKLSTDGAAIRPDGEARDREAGEARRSPSETRTNEGRPGPLAVIVDLRLTSRLASATHEL